MNEVRIFGRHGADNGVLHSGLKIARNRLEVADTTADLNRQGWQRLGDRLDDAGVDGRPRKSTVEVNDV